MKILLVILFTIISLNAENKGNTNDFVKVNILYGSERMNLIVNTDVQDSDIVDSDGRMYDLTDAGKYEFNDIVLEYKKIVIDIAGASFAYEIKDNDVQKVQNDTDLTYDSISSANKDIFIKIVALTGGYGKLEKESPLLNHLSKHQLVKTDTLFTGQYIRNNVAENITMDKSKITYKLISPIGLFSGNFGFKKDDTGAITDEEGDTIWSFWEFTSSKETIPQIIYSTNTNGNDLNFVDHAFRLKKFLISGGHDILTPNGFLYGYQIGAGIASFSLSPEASTRVEDEGVTNLDTSDNPLLIFGSIKLGYQKSFIFKYTEFDFSILYTYEGLNVFNSETDESTDSNGNSTGNADKANIIFDRGEHLNTLKIAARWTF